MEQQRPGAVGDQLWMETQSQRPLLRALPQAFPGKQAQAGEGEREPFLPWAPLVS